MNQDEINQIKQAVREVLLSEEFLKAFAAAWWETPLIHNSELNLEPSVIVCEPQKISEEVKHYSNEVKKYER